MTEKNIAILMATYNGALYLREQIDSILSQTYGKWHLYVHDDGSTDSTLMILEEYASAYDDRITILKYPKTGNSCNNFMSLLKRVKANYYMFTDQDDVWHVDKIELSYKSMISAEAKYPSKPIVVHSDLQVVNKDLKLLHSSFLKYNGIEQNKIKKYEDYIQNVVTGNTMLINEYAKDVSLTQSYAHATMHDAWITLRTIAEGGLRIFIDKPLVDYRQHDSNVLGAQIKNKISIQYRLTHSLEMLKLNFAHFLMMRDAGGKKMTIIKYFKRKLKRN